MLRISCGYLFFILNFSIFEQSQSFNRVLIKRMPRFPGMHLTSRNLCWCIAFVFPLPLSLSLLFRVSHRRRYLCILARESTISGNSRLIDERRVTNSWTSRCRSTATRRCRHISTRNRNVEGIDTLALPRYVGCCTCWPSFAFFLQIHATLRRSYI